MSNAVYDPETEGQQGDQSPHLNPSDNRPAGKASDPRDDLRQAESKMTETGGGGATGTSGPNMNFNAGNKGGFGAETTAGMATASGGVGALAKNSKNFFWSTTKRKRSTVTTAAISITVGGTVIGGSLLSGPFQFIHIAQLMQQFHFTTLQDESDNRMSKLVRYVRYAPRGEAYRTSLGHYGNRFADKFETGLNKQGLKSSYTKYFGYKDGYIIDQGNENFKGKTEDEIKKQIRGEYGDKVKFEEVTADDRSTHLMAKQPSGYRAARTIYRTELRKAGYGKVMSAIGARVMGARDRITWHPLKKLDNALFKGLDKKIVQRQKEKQWQKEKINNIGDGVPKNPGAEKKTEDKPGESDAEKERDAVRADEGASQANNTGSEGDEAAQKAKTGEDPKGPLSTFRESVHVKIGLGGASAAGVLCVGRGVAQTADSIKQDQVIMPLVRTGMWAITRGNNVMAGGKDVTAGQLSFESKQLHDPETKKSWYEAQSIQANLGKPQNGVSPSSTTAGAPLATLSDGSPLDFLLQDPFNGPLSGICDTVVGQGVQLVIGFIGGPFSALGGLLTGEFLGPPVIAKISSYLAGQAVSLNPLGPDYGSYVDFGSFLAANDQGISSGARQLSTNETTQLAEANNEDLKDQFQKHNLAYRLFNPNDRMSLVSSLMDKQSGSVINDTTNMAVASLNVGGSLTSTFSNIFSGVARAADIVRPYDYGGVPEIAFSIGEMDDPDTANPYVNGDEVADILDHNGQGTTPDYISLAEKCFGDTIEQISVPGPNGGSNQVWDVKYGTDPVNYFSPEYKDISNNCNSKNDAVWLKIRFFIFDTLNMKSAACFEGDDEACTDVSFNQSTGEVTDGGPDVTISGDAQQLAQQILDAAQQGKITFDHEWDGYGDAADGSAPLQNIQEMARGEPAKTTSSCAGRGGQPPNATVQIDTSLLKFLVELSQQTHFQINALAGECHSSSSSNHYQGKAVDIGCPFSGAAAANSIGSKYGISDGTGETCDSGAGHYHYSIGGH